MGQDDPREENELFMPGVYERDRNDPGVDLCNVKFGMTFVRM